jgi:Pyruvate/2-oxoacid:ferredoxin oxidoreductase gamma subunit
VGAMLARRPVLKLEAVERTLIEQLSKKKAHLIDANLKVLKRGYEAGLLVTA